MSGLVPSTARHPPSPKVRTWTASHRTLYGCRNAISEEQTHPLPSDEIANRPGLPPTSLRRSRSFRTHTRTRTHRQVNAPCRGDWKFCLAPRRPTNSGYVIQVRVRRRQGRRSREARLRRVGTQKSHPGQGCRRAASLHVESWSLVAVGRRAGLWADNVRVEPRTRPPGTDVCIHTLCCDHGETCPDVGGEGKAKSVAH